MKKMKKIFYVYLYSTLQIFISYSIPIIVFILVVLQNISLKANDQVSHTWKEIASINRDISSYKKIVYSMPDESVWDYTLYSYSDSKNRIRKTIVAVSFFGAIDKSFSMIEYFNTKGSLIYLVYNDSESGKIHAKNTGNAYIKNGKIIKSSSHKMEYHSDKTYPANFIPKPFNKKNMHYQYLLYHKDIDQLNKHIKWISNRIPLSKKEKLPFKFAKEIKNKINYYICINSNSVSMRSKPSLEGKIIYRLNPFDIVQILKKGQEETIEQFGKQHWFKVTFLISTMRNTENRVEGWVLGSFLDVLYQK